MNSIYSCKNISCEAQGADISRICIAGKPFSGVPGKIETAPGLQLDARWKEENEFLSCTLLISRTSGNPTDESFVSFRIPYPAKQSSLMAWMAREGFPKSICEIGGMDIAYGDVCYGAIIPAVSLYDPGLDLGLTIARDPGRCGGRLTFHFDDYHQEGLEVRIHSLEVKEGEVIEQQFRLFGHEGCYRPGLKYYSDLFPEYFSSPVPEIHKYRSFVMTNPFFRKDAVEKLHCDWAEIHNHFPFYGNYLPEEKEWESVNKHDYPEESAKLDLRLTREKVQSHIDDLHKNNIKALYYVQCSGDAFIPWAEKNFPESIARDSIGNFFRTWKNCCFANADESTPFGQYLLKQLDHVLDVYPDLDGFFVDQLCYQAFDYAHSDGKSVRDGQRVYEYGLSLEKNFRRLADLAHAKGKLVLVNGPFDMDVAKGADGIMSEGTGTIFDTYRYICLYRPMLVHEFPHNLFLVEGMLRNALLSAAGWSIGGAPAAPEPYKMPEGGEELFEKYLPLIKNLTESVLYLGADPLRYTPGELAKAEIYKDRGNGNYFVPVLQTNSYCHNSVKLSVKVPEEIRNIAIMILGKPQWENLPFEVKEGRYCLTLPDHFSACLLKFEK